MTQNMTFVVEIRKIKQEQTNNIASNIHILEVSHGPESWNSPISASFQYLKVPKMNIFLDPIGANQDAICGWSQKIQPERIDFTLNNYSGGKKSGDPNVEMELNMAQLSQCSMFKRTILVFVDQIDDIKDDSCQTTLKIQSGKNILGWPAIFWRYFP